MLDKLFQLLKSRILGPSDHTTLDILEETIHIAGAVVEHFEENYTKDDDAYNAAIDHFCQILQEHKKK